MSQIEKDSVTGVETTGHEWDGLKELNLPAPRWWVIMFVITVIWGIGYMVYYPAWPTLSGEGVRGGTSGTAGWTSYQELSDSQAEILSVRQSYLTRFRTADYQTILNDSELAAFARAGGGSAFKDNCATCHGTGGAGGPGYPNLNDDAWLWGGTLASIETSIRYGIRSGHEEERLSEMPAFGDLLSGEEIDQLADHVLSLSGKAPANDAGAALFEEQCSACHAEDGRGNAEMGAPNLADAVWHYGGKRGDVITQIRYPKHGQMPAWDGRLDNDTIRLLTIYVHGLGGGEDEPTEAR